MIKYSHDYKLSKEFSCDSFTEGFAQEGANFFLKNGSKLSEFRRTKLFLQLKGFKTHKYFEDKLSGQFKQEFNWYWNSADKERGANFSRLLESFKKNGKWACRNIIDKFIVLSDLENLKVSVD